MAEETTNSSSRSWIKKKSQQLTDRATSDIDDAVSNPAPTVEEAERRENSNLEKLSSDEEEARNQARREIAKRTRAPIALDLQYRERREQARNFARRLKDVFAESSKNKWYKRIASWAFIVTGILAWIGYNKSAIERTVGSDVARIQQGVQRDAELRRINGLSRLADSGYHAPPPMVYIPPSIANLEIQIAIPERQIDCVRPVAQAIGGLVSNEDQQAVVAYLEKEQARRGSRSSGRNLDLPRFTATGVNWGGGGISWRR